MVTDTVQSTLSYRGDSVIKTYKKSHPFFNVDHFKNEVATLSLLRDNPLFINADCIDFDTCRYTMQRHDFALGTANGFIFNNLARVFFSMTIDEISNNLKMIVSELKNYGVRHRDINPGNLLYCEAEKRIRLSDFFWSENAHNKINLPQPNSSHPWPVNGVFGNDDTEAMSKIIGALTKFYSYHFKPAMFEAMQVFKESIGVGEYRDGSSVCKGYSYHIVDVPALKRHIAHHKSTCIEEYKLIRQSLPIKPTSFIDIGAANGYFTFNLIRDYNIELCHAYEADERSRRLLNKIETLCWLYELSTEAAFDDRTEIQPCDVAIFLNSHMWIHKQLGRDRALNCVSNVLNNCRYMYFQTCGAYSSGMYRVMEYKTPQDIMAMLHEAGATEIKLVGEFIGSHDLPRHMFLVRGGL